MFISRILTIARQEVLALIGAFLLWAINLTIRWKRAGLAGTLTEADGPGIFTFWHNRQLMGALYYRMLGSISKKPAFALISQHADGRMVARAMSYLGLGSVAGSSSKGGTAALLQLTDTLKAGFNAGITPDGPRGPVYKLKSGVVKLAQVSGRPIYPLGIAYSRNWTFKSWDRMILPKPFAKAVLVTGEPIHVPAQLSESEFEEYRCLIERELNEVTQQADETFETRNMSGKESSQAG